MEGDAVHIWGFDLDIDPAAAAAVLSDDEWARARRFHFPVHRDRFIVCRGALRRIIGEWLGVRPVDVTFKYGAFGKPSLSEGTNLHFNVTHSEHRAMIALCEHHPVGIDIERIRELEDLPQLAALVFNDRERRQMNTLSSHDWTHAFFRGWSRKEAYFKATGAGLSAQLHDVTVDLAENAPRLLFCDDDVRNWSMHELPTPTGFIAAVAVPSARAGVIFHEGSGHLR